MADRHRHPPLYFRPAAGDREWLAAHAAETGKPQGRILAEALSAYRAAHAADGRTAILALADEADEIEAALHDETAHRPKPGEVSIGDRIRAAFASVWGDQSE